MAAMNGYFTRRVRREALTQEQKTGLLEDDVDHFERLQVNDRKDIDEAKRIAKEINDRITKVLIALTTTAVVLAANMFLLLAQG